MKRAFLVALAVLFARSTLAEAPDLAASSDLAAGPDLSNMKQIFDDEFDGSTLDLSKWSLGVEPDGSQWGSDSYFVTSKPSDAALVSSVYIVADGVLTIRANHNAALRDPMGWNQKWYSGMISTAFPDGRNPSALFRQGYVEVRAKMPAGLGVWPAFWALNMRSMKPGGDPKGQIELDGLEYYGSQMTTLYSTVHWWTKPHQQAGGGVEVLDMSAGFHTYGFLLDASSMTIFFDGRQVGQRPLFRASDIDKFYWMFDLAMGGGWPITVPQSGRYEMQIDYVRIWSADAAP
jgi:beta-glucanase (GH16 family)